MQDQQYRTKRNNKTIDSYIVLSNTFSGHHSTKIVLLILIFPCTTHRQKTSLKFLWKELPMYRHCDMNPMKYMQINPNPGESHLLWLTAFTWNL